MKLALGTVQFGLPYGIANQSGQVSREDAKNIVALARLSGIDTLDTAIVYGESETCLGEMGLEGVRLITKLPVIPEGVVDVGNWVHSEMRRSLQRLNVKMVYGLLLHSPQELIGTNGKNLAKAIRQLKIEGKVKKIGVSIYAPSELENVMNVCAIDIVQAPFNIIDKRLQTSGWLQKLYDARIEVHTRSTFLQGLLLMPVTSIPVKFKHWLHLFEIWHRWLLDNNISATEACLGFVQDHPQIERIVVGVDSVWQLKQLIQAAKKIPNIKWPDINCFDEYLINPSKWSEL